MKKHVTITAILIFSSIIIFCLTTKEPEIAAASPVLTATNFAVEDTLFSPQDSSAIPPIITSPSSAGEVSFPHQLHYEDFEIGCKTCHHEINAAKLDVPHEEYFDDFWIDCKICHHKEGTTKLEALSCSNCHHSRPTDIADETLSSKVVIHKNCWECHDIGTGEEASQNCIICHSGERTKFKNNNQ